MIPSRRWRCSQSLARSQQDIVISLVLLAGLFVVLFSLPITRNLGSIAIIGLALTCLLWLAASILAWRLNPPPMRLMIQVAAVTTLIVVNYSWIYWSSSPHPGECMNARLSKIDSIYVTLGMLTTVGSGDIFPVTQVCRALVSSQLMISITLISVILGLLANRISQRG